MTELRRRVEPTLRLAEAGLPGRILGRLVEVAFLDRMVTLAGQAFSAVLPLFMVVSTLSPHPGGDSPATLMARRLGLDPSSVSSLQSVVAPPSSARASIGVLGVLLALLTATSFARALQRSYELAWRLPPAGGLRAAWRALALVVGLALYIELLFLFGRMVRGVPASTLLEDLATLVGAWALWTGAGWILLAGRVRPRLLATGGLLTAVGFATLRQLSAFYLPSLVATNQQFGLLGVAFTLFSWLTVCSLVIVVATVVGTVLTDDPGRLGRLIRTPRR